MEATYKIFLQSVNYLNEGKKIDETGEDKNVKNEERNRSDTRVRSSFLDGGKIICIFFIFSDEFL